MDMLNFDLITIIVPTRKTKFSTKPISTSMYKDIRIIQIYNYYNLTSLIMM